MSGQPGPANRCRTARDRRCKARHDPQSRLRACEAGRALPASARATRRIGSRPVGAGRSMPRTGPIDGLSLARGHILTRLPAGNAGGICLPQVQIPHEGDCVSSVALCNDVNFRAHATAHEEWATWTYFDTPEEKLASVVTHEVGHLLFFALPLSCRGVEIGLVASRSRCSTMTGTQSRAISRSMH